MISIIIPVLNEETTIEGLLKQVNRVKGDKEILVVDGGSQDRTPEVAEKYAKVIRSDRGRANQMNQGARHAKGDILWFVHSDSIVHDDALKAIEGAIGSGFIGGGFSLYFHDYDTAFMRYISITSNWRAKYFRLYFGDQGIFVKKTVFNRLNGFPKMDLMEDWAMSKQLKKAGKLKMLSVPLGTSGRRFKEGGALKTHLFMHKIKLLYMLGVGPEKLVKLYREAR